MSDELMEEGDLETTVASLQSRTKLLSILLILAVVIALGSVGYAFVSVKAVSEALEQVAATTAKLDSGRGEEIEGIAKPSREVGIIHPLGNFVVNLLDPGNVRYVNCRIEVEVDDSSTVKEITGREAVFKDAVISLLGNQTYSDLLGPEGKSRVREELLVRFNRMLPAGHISRVYITEFVVQ